MNKLHFGVIAMLSLCAGAAFGSDKVNEKRVAADSADTPAKFSQVIEEVHQEMGEGGRYEFMKSDAKAQVDADLTAMDAMMKKAGSVGAMNEQDKIALFNRQEHLNGILTHNDGNRLVCERRAPMGSNIPVTMCKTVAEIEKTRHDAQKKMQDSDRYGWGPTHGQ
ncbi:MAG: hypothetical protein ABI846_14915 [Rudaea sp.]